MTRPHALARAAAAALLLVPTAAATASDGPPDLSGTVPILVEDFSGGLGAPDGSSGPWSTESIRGRLMANAAETVFVHPDDPLVAGTALPPTMVATPEGLSIRTVPVPPDALAAIRARMRATGQGRRAESVRYATGRITTVRSWAQTYGWFEVEARIPRGKGRWPAFWLNFAGPGWPPEIDVFEAYGEGIAAPTPKDGRFNTAVLFDELDARRRPVHGVDVVNPFDDDPATRIPRVKQRGGRDIHTLARHHVEPAIYDRTHVWAVAWTPDHIAFYFGPDRDSLREIYRTPTPDDAHDPMYVIANDQFTAQGGAWGADAALDAVLDPANDFLVRRIEVRAWRPGLVLDMAAGDRAFDPRASVIRDTAGDDVVAPGGGFDVIELSGGADEIRVSRGREGTVVEGFGPDDRLVVEGFPYADGAAAHASLSQVGADVWLTAPGDPFWPQSVILRDVRLAEVAPSQIDSRWPVGPDVWATRADLPGRPQTDADGDGLLEAPAAGGWLNDASAPVRLIGGPGPERYLASARDTRIEEPADGGVDELIAWGDWRLPENVERGILRGEGGRIEGGPGPDRLELEGRNGQAYGGAGDDLYVIAPEARRATVWIGADPGHDRLRGLREGHTLLIAAALRSEIDLWTREVVDEGVLIRFSPDQSLLVEGAGLAADGATLTFPEPDRPPQP